MRTYWQTNQRNFYLLFLVLTLLTLTISCNQNKLKTNENVLTEKIRSEEEQLTYEADLQKENEKQLADSLAKLPKGFRFKEERGIDPNHPPVVIDIANSLKNIKKFSLSDVATSVEYIRMESVPDSTLPTNMKYKYYLMDNNIVATNLYGMQLFSKNGKYIRTIVKNQMSGIFYDEKKDIVHYLWSDYMKIGGETTIWARGNDLFYIYKNSNTGQLYIMEYDCSNKSSISNLQFEPENPKKIMGAGKVSVDLNYGHTPVPSQKRSNGSMGMSASCLYAQMDLFAPDRNITVQTTWGKNMMLVRNTRGDTLASFTKYEQVKNYTKQVGRGTDVGSRYEKNGNMFYRTDFNDTVFQVIPPNRLLPVYVYHLEDYKLTKLQGMDPGFNLDGKIIPQNFADTKDYLFLTFDKDSYDCPNNRTNKSLKLYHAIFSKKDKQLYIVQGDPTDYDAQILKNDIDGGMHVWPDEMMIGKNGEIIISLNGAEIKAQVKSSFFKQSKAPEDKKDKLRRLAESVRDNEQILMVVK